MTLFQALITSILLATASVSQAYIIPGDGRGERPAPYEPADPIQGGLEDRNRDDRDRRGGGRQDRTSVDIVVNRYIKNEVLHLLQEGNLNRYRGYRVESVRVMVMRAREVNSS